MPHVAHRPSLSREYRAEPGSTVVTRRSMAYNGRDDDVIAIGSGPRAFVVVAT
jgi:hypothetical protein